MNFSRRSFFLHAPVAGMAAAAPDWSAVRRQFSLDPRLLYFNAANIAPAPEVVTDAWHKQVRLFMTDPSFQAREQYKGQSERVRARLAAWIGAKPGEVAITRNTSEGNNLVAQGVPLRPGDEVLVTAHNHPSNHASWNLRASQKGARVVIVPVPMDAAGPAEIVESIARGVTPRTRVIALSHFTNTTGLRYPVQEIAGLARRQGAWFHVDGAQTVGWLRVDVAALGVDSYTASFSKWPMGPLESGLLFVRAERQRELSPAILSVDYWADKPSESRQYEQLGQRDDARLAGMERMLDFHAALGAETIESRTLLLAGKLRAALRQVPGAVVRGSGVEALSGPVVKVDFPSLDLQALSTRLWDRHRVALAVTPGSDARGLRFSPHIYNSEAEIEAVAGALAERG
jgi:selenocysteine lyase/cysteine desulfurase